MSASAIKEKSKKTPKKGPDDYVRDPSELGESIDTLAEVELKMRLEAMDTFGKWYVAKVLEIDEESGEVLVHFDRWSSRYDEYIPIGSGRLRKLTASRLKELQKEREPVYMIGDRIQAKWEDGKMYFGKVLQVYEDTVDVLFDDGVEYTAPFRAVRRRRPDKPTEHHYDSSTDSSEAAEARRSRARKRMRDDDSASQSSMSSPPSSPLTFSARKRPYRMVDSDSTEAESDFDDSSHPHIGERQVKQRSTGTSSGGEHSHKPPPSDGEHAPKMMDHSSEGGGECSLTTAAVVSGSDESEHPIPVKRGRGRPRKLREPYKLRKGAMLEPVQENEARENVEAGEGGKVMGGALLTPPSGDCTPHSKPPIPKPVTPSVSSDKELTKQIPNPTPPETPQTDSHSESGILKRMLSQDESPIAASDQTKKTPPTQEGSTSPSSKKKSPVSSRTRAQTKFENITKKVDRKDKKQAKTAPKELVIMWDHNEFKCKFTGCNKSFRKESLLQSHVKHYHTKETRLPRTPSKTKGPPSGAAKKSQSPRSPRSQTSPLSPSGLSLSPCSPRTPGSHDSETATVKSPRTRKLKSILSPLPRRNPSRSKASVEMIENREKSPTESFFEFMEKEKKSGEVMHLLELATKEHQKTAAAFHVHVRPTHAPMKVAEKGGGGGGGSSGPSKGGAPSKATTVSATSKKASSKQNVSGAAMMSTVAGLHLKGSAVEIRALSHDSLPPHPSPNVRTTSESSLTKGGMSEAQLNNSDSVDEMDTSNELEGGESHPLNETSEEDVVHCLCGSTEDEGFMIQCEQCLCWQHGDCVGLTEETLPKKYICYICGNPPGLRKRYQYQFDQDWFGEGALPSLPGGPKFTNTESMRRTHELAGQLYKLRKMMHSSKVKLQAASTVNHPYLKQWAKECVHRTKDDIMAYIMRSLFPVSYPPQQGTSDHHELKGEGAESATTSSEGRQLHDNNLSDTERADDLANSNIVGAAAFSSQNGTDQVQKDDSDSPPIDVSSLQLDPLPQSSPSPKLPPTPPEDPPDPKSLQLAPLPPLSAEDRSSPAAVSEQKIPSPSEREAKPAEIDAGSINMKSPRHPNAGAGVSLEVFNDEFGVQEMSVFATSENQHQVSATQKQRTNVPSEQPPNPHAGSNPTAARRLISGARSAFTPVIVTLRDASSPISTSLSSETTPQSSTNSARREGGNKTADSAAAAAAGATSTASEHQKPVKCEYDSAAVKKTLSCLPSTAKSKSGMDSVTLGEFSEAFMKGDTTNWFQRMLLLDHIEAVQDKIRSWMEMIDKQLDGMPDDDSQLEDVDALMKNVQSSIEELGKLQQQAATVS